MTYEHILLGFGKRLEGGVWPRFALLAEALSAALQHQLQSCAAFKDAHLQKAEIDATTCCSSLANIQDLKMRFFYSRLAALFTMLDRL